MRKAHFLPIFFIVLGILFAPFGDFGIGGARVARAQTASDLTLSQDQRAQLESELSDLEAQMAQKQKELATQQGVSGSLSTEIKNLTTQINTKKSAISIKNKLIDKLTASIGDKKNQIVSLSQKIQNQKDSLAQLIRKTDEMDRSTLTDFLLSDSTLSIFYSDVSRFDTLKSEVKKAVDTITTIKGATEQKKTELEKQQTQTIDEKKALVTIQKSIEQDKATQNVFLSLSKNKEAEYQKIIADQQAKVSAIKAKLFALAGGGQAIRFDIALQYATEAQNKTSIDPAFLLAIATQESNLGSNVGACYLSDTSTGAGVNIKTGKTYVNVMSPKRDVPPFMQITSKLGMNPLRTNVSCPIPSAGGWGGAMGPAQFIASTWQLFDARIKSALGVQNSDPWNPEHAFMASAMYLTDLGAVGDSYTGQMKAACSYYGTKVKTGQTCTYGRSVQKLKASIQSDIDYLKQYGISRR